MINLIIICAHTKLLKFIDYIPFAIYYILVTYLFYNWKFLPLTLLHLFCPHLFFLPLVTPSEFSWGNHTPHSPPSPPQPMWFRQHWYALYSPHPVQGGQMTSVVTVNTHDQGCPWQFPFYLKQSELCLSPAPKGLQVSTGPSWDWIFISCFLLTH